ncbi:MAG: gluconokinase [Acidobacteriaceae bacterium]
MVIVLMGVTGRVKTTVGQALALAMGCVFADADDFHSAANRAKMHASIPLTDEDRAPWLASLHKQIALWLAAGKTAVLACSALKESYRAYLSADAPPGSVRFVYLTGPASIIHDRLEARQGHYMPASLLTSQIAALEPPRDALEVSIAQPVPAIVQQILTALSQEGYAGTSSSKGGL